MHHRNRESMFQRFDRAQKRVLAVAHALSVETQQQPHCSTLPAHWCQVAHLAAWTQGSGGATLCGGHGRTIWGGMRMLQLPHGAGDQRHTKGARTHWRRSLPPNGHRECMSRNTLPSANTPLEHGLLVLALHVGPAGRLGALAPVCSKQRRNGTQMA